MIEMIDNLIQMLMAAVVFSAAFYRALRAKGSGRENASADAEGVPDAPYTASREWFLVGLFAFEYFIGDLYGVLHLLFYEKTGHYVSISDMSWYTAYLFMILLLICVSEGRPWKMESRLQLLIPAFTVAMAVIFYLRNGDLVGNIVSAAIMTIAIWRAVDGVIEEKKKEIPGKKPVYGMCLILLALEYALWISSSFLWAGDTLKNPYFWIDTLFSLSLVGLLWAVGKAVRT
ncbi:MAG: hypothetical protein E7294_05475 [Lachnospiraceae bacterium]|jgi:hypothetical protein|nr:hypothetical protein [Lachnospiraceae bacterium]